MNRTFFAALLASVLGTSALAAPASAAAPTATMHFASLVSSGQNSTALGINNHGQIVGWGSNQTSFYESAVSWSGGTMISLPTLGFNRGVGFAINDAGLVVGDSYDAAGRYRHAASFFDGKAVDLGTLGGHSSGATAVNEAGMVAGWSYLAGDKQYRATVWNGGVATALGTLGGGYSAASGINEKGVVVGYSTNAAGAYRAVSWLGGTASELATLGGSYTSATGVNDSGQIVGVSTRGAAGTDYRAVRWDAGMIVDLGTLGGASSFALGINTVGQAVGWADTAAGGVSHAVLWNGTAPTDLNSLLDQGSVDAGWVLAEASGINDAGSIIGRAFNTRTFAFDGFVLTPGSAVSAVPETATWTSMVAGLMLISVGAVRRRESIKFENGPGRRPA